MRGDYVLMRIEIFVIVCALLGISVSTAACTTGDTMSEQPASQASASPTPPVEIEPSPFLDSPIRTIDFANFTYPAKSLFSDGMKSFRLQLGRYEGDQNHDPVILASLAYGDVTGDAVEEAMVVLGVSVRGTAIPHAVYIYTLQNETPELLWAFQTGDRGDGGLRQVYVENGRLVIELYGKDKLIGKNLYESDPYEAEGVCCPKFFTRARYTWQDVRFKQEGSEELLPNPEGHGSLVMARYRRF